MTHDLLASPEPEKCAECASMLRDAFIRRDWRHDHEIAQDKAVAQAVRAAAQSLSPSMNPIMFLQSLEYGTSPAVLCRELDKLVTPVP